MGKSGVSLNWGGLDKCLDQALDKLKERRRAVLEAVGEALVSGTAKRFEKGVGPDGKAWEPSGRAWRAGLGHAARKKTAKRKGRRFKAASGAWGKTLLDTGRLRTSISAKTAGNEVFVGSNLEYARIHQLGGKAGRGRKTALPARPYLGISEEDKEEVAGIIGDYLKEAFKE
jgi:phage gpG-like protein